MRVKKISEAQDPFLRSSRWHQALADLLFDPDKYILLSTWGQRIGHTSTEIMTAVCIAIRDKKQLILITPFKSVNKEIFNCRLSCPTYEKKDWKIWALKSILNFSLFFHYLYNGIRSKIVKYLPSLSKIIPSIFFYPCYGFERLTWGVRRLKGAKFYSDVELFLSQKYQIQLTPEQLIFGNKMREEMGIPKHAWFVCLHVREDKYAGPSIRDASIDKYLSAIEYIAQKGGFVIRMGDPTMSPLQQMENVIDYALSEFRSESMDLYLIYKCLFFFGCDSGLLDLSRFFRKHICAVNVSNLISGATFFPQNICIPKHVYSNQERRFLSLKEVLNLDDMISNLSDQTLVENTSEEIIETVKEYIYFLEYGNFYSSDDFQEEIRNIRNKHFQDMLKKDLLSAKQRELMGMLPAQGRIGSFYLERCWDNTPYLQKLTKLYNREE